MSFRPGFQIPVSLNFHDFMFKLFPRFHSLWVQKHCINCSISFYWLSFVPSTTQYIADPISSFPQSFLGVSTFALSKLGNSPSLSSFPAHLVDKQLEKPMRAMTSGFRWSCTSHRRMRLPDKPALRGCGEPAASFITVLAKWRGCSLPIVGSCFGNWPSSVLWCPQCL